VPISVLVIVLALVGGGTAAAPAAVAVVVALTLTYGLELFPPKPRHDAIPWGTSDLGAPGCSTGRTCRIGKAQRRRRFATGG
jgi:hypothetical protein